MLDYVFTRPGEPLYGGKCDLRFRVLREPLGYTRDAVAFPFEDDSLHLVATEGDRVVGCVLFHPDGVGGGRLFQMAVDPALQGQGVGRALVDRLEAHLLTIGITQVILHARHHAIGFYERLGYRCFGAPYEEVGIPHRNMRKALDPPPADPSVA